MAKFDELQRKALEHGAEGQNAIYDFMQTFQEAKFLRCLNTDVTLDTSFYLYERAAMHLQAGAEVIELGCWTGGLCSFMAERHAQCRFIGVDRAKKILDLNRGLYRLPNLSFSAWDCRGGKPAGIERADILLCGLGTTYACPPGAYDKFNPCDIRGSQGYDHELKEALRYFKSWRSAAKPGARLMTVLRAQTFPRFAAFIDAASRAGLTCPNEFAYVACEANQERLPFFSFVAEPSASLDEDAVLALQVRMADSKDNLGEVEGPAALAIYRVLEKQQLRSEQWKGQNGIPTWVEIGRSGAFTYVFTRDSGPNFKLSLFPRWQADELIAALEMKFAGHSSRHPVKVTPVARMPVAEQPPTPAHGFVEGGDRGEWSSQGGIMKHDKTATAER